jgi:phage baseplate assembly protein W
MASTSLIGTGWAFPIRPDPSGGLRYVSDAADIERAIEVILRTAPGERVMTPSFGAGLRSQVFLPNTPQTQRGIEHTISEALQRLEPRIGVNQVTAASSEAGPHLLDVSILYSIRSTGITFTRVFKLSLTEES